MSNMSYCRWHNTAHALLDCAYALEEEMQGGDPDDEDTPAPLSDDESQARRRLFNTMTLMLQQIGVNLEMSDVMECLSSVSASTKFWDDVKK